MADNTLFLRLAGPMQAWGTSSKFQLRRTDLHPSKSGVLGLLLAARGIGRHDSHNYLPEVNGLLMGVRIDEAGIVGEDYHTVGAKIGIRKAEGRIKQKKGKPPETLLSRRQYLFGASFLVALQGDPETIAVYAAALQSPVWPPFLGRKSCIPSEPIFAGMGRFGTLLDALESQLCSVMEVDPEPADDEPAMQDRECWIEVSEAPETSAAPREVYDTPQRFGYWNYLPRRLVKTTVTVPLKYLLLKSRTPWEDPYGPEWPKFREARLEFDGYQCVFCQSPAAQVHHIDYENVCNDTLRSLCELCHDACTMLEYARGDKPARVDPSDPNQREELLRQIEEILKGRKKQRRRKLLQGQ
jgi:CRISPR system Cascade subunit CasD